MHCNHRIHAELSPTKLIPVNTFVSSRRFDPENDGELAITRLLTSQQ